MSAYGLEGSIAQRLARLQGRVHHHLQRRCRVRDCRGRIPVDFQPLFGLGETTTPGETRQAGKTRNRQPSDATEFTSPGL
jgi:hypothetical protein